MVYAMSAQQATIPDLQVYEQPEADGSLMDSDVHKGRPMRPEYAERGAAFQRAYLRGLPVGMTL